MGHRGALGQPPGNAVGGFQQLVLVAGQLGRAGLPAHQPVVGVIDPQPFGVVDVVHHQRAGGAVDHPQPVGDAGGRGGQVGGPAVGPGQGDVVGHVHPQLVFGTHPLHPVGVVKDHLGKVQRVDPHVQQRPAGQLGPGDAGHLGVVVAEVGGQQPGGADLAGLHHLPDAPAHRLVAGPDGLGHQQAPVPGFPQGDFGLAGVDGEGFLAQNMLAVGHAHPDLPVMVGVGGGDVHKVHRRVGQHRLVPAVGPLHPVGPGEGFGPVGLPGRHRVQFDLRVAVLVQQPHGPGHHAGDGPGAENSQFHSVFPPSRGRRRRPLFLPSIPHRRPPHKGKRPWGRRFPRRPQGTLLTGQGTLSPE